MAFAKQYFSSYKSNNNLDYYLEIWVDGYTGGNPTEIKLGAGGPVISYDTDQEDRFSPILSSQCELPFMVTGISTESFITLLRTTYQEKQVYLHLYRATSSTYTTTKPIWSGFLVMDLGSGEDVAFPYEQKLRFIDGLSLLKDIDFVDLSKAGSETNIQGSYTQDNMYYGPAIYTFWIKEILKKIGSATTTQGVSINYGFTTAVNWYNADMQNTNQGSDPLGLTQCIVSMFHKKNEQDVFTPENCYTVLKEILRHWGARITYWKHEFWIVQIPEYITTESGFIDNPDNINSRQYDLTGSLIGSQDHLGDTFYTRYEQTIQSNQVSKIVGTKYNYLPVIHNVEADFLSFASQNYYGGFPFGVNAEDQEIFQGTIIDASTADFLWLSIPLNWVWDMSGTSLPNGHTNGWWSYVKFNFYASDGTSTYYLQYNSSNDSYYWVIQADWIPLGNTSPKYIIKSRNITETNYIGFEEQIPFVDSSGNAIAMTGAWSFFLDIEKFGTNSSNVGSFYCRFSGYPPSSYYSYVKADPTSNFPTLPDPSGSGTTLSGKVSWSNTLQNPSGVVATSFSTPAGFDAGTSQADIQLITSSPFKGFLQTLNTTQSATFGISLNTQIDNSTNTEAYTFGTLLWGDAFEQFAIGCLRVNNGSTFVKTNADGKWGRGVLTGEKTFTELLINEFLTGQIEVVISPTMRLAVGDQNKNQTASASGGGTAERPRYVNPIGILRETRNGVDPVYFFRRGSFHSLYDEWDYEGYQILRDSVTSTTTSNDIGGLGGSQDNNPVSAAKIIGNVTDALMMNSPVAYLRTNVQATGANVVVNGNFNVATGWVLGTGWSIDTTASKAKFAATGSLSSLSQINLTEGTKYQIIFTIDITAGQLSVKAGTSGGSQVITVSGQYEIYLLCGGSTSIEFQAGTTFTGSISQVSIAEQKSLSSVPIESLGEAVFKTNDTLNLVNSIGGDIIPLIVTSNQGATDTAISVTAVPLFDDIGIDSVLLINQDDLSAQYQNKTKGTVAGFDITATGIEKSSINITDWLNSDTMTGAAVTNVPTALSVKNYVDGQVGANDTLQEVTDNGNTTTNSIMIGSSSSPSAMLEVNGGEIRTTRENVPANHLSLSTTSAGSFIKNAGGTSKSLTLNNTSLGSPFINFQISSTEKMRLTTTGLGIGTTSSSRKLCVQGTNNTALSIVSPNTNYVQLALGDTDDDNYAQIILDNNTNILQIQNGGGSIVSNRGITLDSSERVGIGIKNPDAILHIKDANPRIIKLEDANYSNQYATIGFDDGHLKFSADPAGQRANSVILFNIDNSEKARILSGGNLLIGGTTDNGAILEISQSIPIFRITGTRNANWTLDQIMSTLQFYSGDASGSAANSVRASISLVSESTFGSTTGLSFATKADASGLPTEKVRISAFGNFGINTLLPTEKLHVVDDALITGDSHADAFKPAATGEPIKFKRYDGFEVGRFKNNGYFGINVSDPQRSLDIGGAVRILNENQIEWGWGGVRITGSVSTNTFKIGTWGGSSVVDRLIVETDGQLNLSAYGSGTFTGTATKTLGVTSSGDVIELTGGGAGGPFLPLAGGTLTGLLTGTTAIFTQIELSDNQPIYLGTGAVMKIFNDGANSIVRSQGEPLNIDANGINFRGYSPYNNLMKINSNGNVLIGTTTDSGQKLQINGSITISDIGTTRGINRDNDGYNLKLIGGVTTTSSAYIEINGGSRGGVGNAFNGKMLLSTGSTYQSSQSNLVGDYFFQTQWNGGSTTLMKIISSNGNVLIGTSVDTSFYKLEVNGNVRVGTNLYIGNVDAVTTATEVLVRQSERVRGITPANLVTAGGAGVFLPLTGGTLTGALTGTTAAFINSGNGQLDVKRTGGANTFIQSQTITGVIGTNTNHKLDIKTNGSTKIRITTGGNVLIGTTTDVGGNRKIQVAGGDFYTAEKSNTAGANAGYGGSSFQIRNGSTSEDLNFDLFNRTSFNWYTPFVIKNTGNVLIGTTTDSGAKLQVSGTVLVQSSSAGAFTIQGGTGVATTGAFVLRQTGDGSGNGIAITSSFATSHRIWKNSSGDLNIGTSSSPSQLVQKVNGNLLIGTTVDNGRKLQVNGDIQIGDNDVLRLGDSSDLNLFHTGTGTVIQNSVGNLTLQQDQNNGNIVFRCDNGTGGTTSYITLDGSQTTINLQQNVLIGSTSDNGQQLQVTGNIRITGGFQTSNTGGFLLADTGGSMRYGLKYGAAGAVGSSNLLMLTNRSLSSATGGGEVAISANASTSGVTETEVMRIKANTQSQVSIDGVLSLTSQNTPADPPNRASTIWLDSNFDLKIKITNNSGVTVTKTIVEYA